MSVCYISSTLGVVPPVRLVGLFMVEYSKCSNRRYTKIGLWQLQRKDQKWTSESPHSGRVSERLETRAF